MYKLRKVKALLGIIFLIHFIELNNNSEAEVGVRKTNEVGQPLLRIEKRGAPRCACDTDTRNFVYNSVDEQVQRRGVIA